MYDPDLALAAIDANRAAILLLMAGAVGFSFIYFLIAVKMAIAQKAYVVPFLGASLFFWHDLSFVLHYPVWVSRYGGHWWLSVWSAALIGTVALEAYLIGQFIRYGRSELMPEASKMQFTALTILATLGIGALWWLVKASMADPIYLVTFAITAVWSVPFHTGIMLRRKSRVGQSVAMEASVMVIFACVSGVLMIAAPFFRTPPYLVFFATFMIWPAVNIWLYYRYPPIEARDRSGGDMAAAAA